MVGPILSHSRAILRVIFTRLHRVWKRYRSLKMRYQVIIAIAVIAALIALSMALAGGKKAPAAPALRTVTLESMSSLSGTGATRNALGSVRSVTEADILAQSGGTVRSVNASVGRSVGPGYVIAELENDSQRAAVLQAEGAYDAALASRAAVSPVDSATAARNAYRAAFTSLDTTLQNDIDAFFGANTPSGPNLLINPIGSDPTELSRERAEISRLMNEWRSALLDADARDPENLLIQAELVAREIQAFVEKLAQAANATDSRATSAQLASLAAGRASIAGAVSALSSAQVSFRSGTTSSTASVDASVKSALGSLRLAQAALEKTVVRAPIGGTINFLPIRVGDYVTPLQHVATVAQNGALEIVLFISEETRADLAVGDRAIVEGAGDGVITSISPALDPVTKQIEVHVAVDGGSPLVNGQSVNVGLPDLAEPAAATSTGMVLLPLSSVKLTAGARVIFTVEEGRLVAIPVEIGEVRGERIEVIVGLSAETRIVKDARGLSEGQAVNVTLPSP
jgi:RND family efflux transporter MFP subunit